MDEQESKPANLTERQAAKVIRPENFREYHASPETHAVKKKSGVEENNALRRDG